MRIIRRSAIAVVVLVLVATGSLFLYSYRLRKSAEYTVRIAYELSEKKQSPTIAELRQLFGNGLRQLGCGAYSECSYEVVLSNRFLSTLRVVPYTELRSYF